MIRLHHVPWSRSFRIKWLLAEMGIAHETEIYSITDGSMRTPDYLAKSPAGRVPALEIDGRVLFESGAITEYLCETRPDHGLGRAPGHEERAEYLEWLHYAETMAALIANLNLQWVFLREPEMRSPTLLKIEASRLKGIVKALDAALDGRDYLLASGFSAADTMFGYNLWAMPRYVRLEPFANVRAYIERTSARPAYIQAAESEPEQKFYTQEFYEVG